MSELFGRVVVSVAPGSGRLARRANVLLFDPSGGNADLVGLFDQAMSDEAAIAAIKHQLIEREFTAKPLIVIDWVGKGVELLVFGDADVYSSAPAAPMISGAGSSSWVERSLGALELGDAANVDLWSGADADPATDLRLGIVECGGLRMSVQLLPGVPRSKPIPTTPPPAPAPDSTVQPPAAAPGLAVSPDVQRAAGSGQGARPHPSTPPVVPAADLSAVAKSAPPVPAAESASPPATPSPPAPPETAAAPDVLIVPADPVSVSLAGPDVDVGSGAMSQADDPFAPSGSASPDNAAAEFGWADTEPKPAAPAAEDPLAANNERDPFAAEAVSDDQITDSAVSADVHAQLPVPLGAGLVEASVCANGHGNPPRSSSCRVCASVIDPDAEVTLIAQPTVGTVRFAHGLVLELNDTYVVGRKPSIDGTTAQLVKLDTPEVSRMHLELVVDGWSALLKDLGSRNGTWVVTQNEPTPLRLDEQVPYVLDHGTTVHLGGSEASFTYEVATHDSDE